MGVFSPYLSHLGGGDRYMAILAEILAPEHEVELVSLFPVDLGLLRERLGVQLENVQGRALHRAPSGTYRWLDARPRMHLYRDLYIANQAMRASRSYDLFIAQYFMSLAPARAARNILHIQFPHNRLSWRFFLRKPLYWPYALMRYGYFRPELASYEAIVCQSEYVRSWTRRRWEVDSDVIYPPNRLPETWWTGPRDRVILNVGRFFGSGYNKAHGALIEGMRRLAGLGVTDWELHLVGSRHYDKPVDIAYYDGLVEAARGLPVHFHPDASREELDDLYRRAAIFWHGAGYGADFKHQPEFAEHFGMATVEAMSHGVAPVVIGRGGQLEIVRDGIDGRTWATLDQLAAITRELINDEPQRRRLAISARERSLAFGVDPFRSAFLALLKRIGVSGADLGRGESNSDPALAGVNAER